MLNVSKPGAELSRESGWPATPLLIGVPPSAAASPAPGWRAWLEPRYSLLQPVEETARGSWWLAEEVGQGRVVWLEVLTEAVAADELTRAAFYHEAEAAARLHHPHIVRATAAERLGPTHFRVLEQIRGGLTLRHVLAQSGWLEPRRAVQLALQLLNALTYAHQLGVWHLALQPECVWLDANGEAVLGGFGVGADPAFAWVGQQRAAQAAPAYLSPEQLAEQGSDARSDYYALGVLLYEMLTDRVPFDSNDREYLKQRQRVQAPQPPVNFRPEVPPALSELVMQLLVRLPEQRSQAFPAAESLGSALRQAGEAHGWSTAGPARPTNPLPLLELSSAVAAAELLRGQEACEAPAPPIWQPESVTRPWLTPVTQGWSNGSRWALAAALLCLGGLGWWGWSNGGGLGAEVFPAAGGTAEAARASAPLAANEVAEEGNPEAPALTHIVPAAPEKPSVSRNGARPTATAAATAPEPARTTTARPAAAPPEAQVPAAAPPAVPSLSRPRTVAEINAALAAGQALPQLPAVVPGNTDARALPPAPAADAGPRAARRPIKFGAPLKRSETRLPADSRALAGVVAVKVTVNERGQVTNARAVAGPKALYARAEAAARQWRFQPSTRDGVPLTVVRQINFDFRPAATPARRGRKR